MRGDRRPTSPARVVLAGTDSLRTGSFSANPMKSFLADWLQVSGLRPLLERTLMEDTDGGH